MSPPRWPSIRSPDAGDPPASLVVRLAWMVAIWAACVGALGVFAWLLRLLLHPAVRP